jgi:hypothetical protein
VTTMGTNTTVTTNMTTTDAARVLRRGVLGLAAAGCLLGTPFIAARAAEDRPAESAVSVHAKSFGVAVKRDTKAVGAACKDGAHRVAVAAKAVAHEIATAAKRGAAQTRAAFGGHKGSESREGEI